MRKKLSVVVFLCSILTVTAQHRESDILRKKLQWDDSMLNIMIDTRFDLQTGFDNKEINEKSFYSDYLKLWFEGSITPKIHYRLRQRLNKAQDPNSRDGLAGATDHIWVSFDVSDAWTITVGKQAVQFGTFEYDYSSADEYLTTMIYSDLASAEVGVNAAYKFSNQVLNLQVINSNSTQFASEEYKNKALAFNAMWQGSLFDDLLKTRWGYGLFQHDKKKFYNWATLGTQVNIDKFSTELDYYYGDRNMDYGSMVSDDTLGLSYVQDQSAAVNVRYNLGMWRPFVKAVWSQRYDNNLAQKAYNSVGVEAVAECYPFKSDVLKDLRFHAAYSYTSTSFDNNYASLPNADEHKILVGMRWMFKVK